MEQQKVDLFMATHGDKFPGSQHPSIRQILEGLDEGKFNIVMAQEYKSPNTILLISLFVGSYGVDRFMLKDKNAIWKLLTCGGCGIWTIADWFSAKDRARAYNFNQFQEASK